MKTEDTRKKAVALKYDAEKAGAPKIVAKGAGHLADRIIEVAREHDIHLHEDPDLVTVLSKLEIQTEIPDQLYRAIAEILAFLYQLNKAASPGPENIHD